MCSVIYKVWQFRKCDNQIAIVIDFTRFMTKSYKLPYLTSAEHIIVYLFGLQVWRWSCDKLIYWWSCYRPHCGEYKLKGQHVYPIVMGEIFLQILLPWREIEMIHKWTDNSLYAVSCTCRLQVMAHCMQKQIAYSHTFIIITWALHTKETSNLQLMLYVLNLNNCMCGNKCAISNSVSVNKLHE